jgi:hypothetical protein
MRSTAEFQADYEAALHKRRKEYGAAWFTVEALMYSMRERGERALAEPDCLRRLSELSVAQLRQVIRRLDRLRDKYPAVTDELLLHLGRGLP